MEGCDQALEESLVRSHMEEAKLRLTDEEQSAKGLAVHFG